MEEFLVSINDHEINYKAIIKKFEKLKSVLEESIKLEDTIQKLSSNQQLINISEYVNLHNRVCGVIRFFNDSYLIDKEDFVENMVNLEK